MYYRNCPKCGEEIFYMKNPERDRAEKRNTNCKSCANTGRIFSNEHKKNIGKSNKGKIRSEETRKNISKTLKGREPWNKGLTKETNDIVKKHGESRKGQVPWNKGLTKYEDPRLKHSEETRKNMRLAALKRNGVTFPNYNSVACGIINNYNKKYGFNFQHAENGGEVCIDGYWPDGVDEKRKIIIEVDEKHHFDVNGKLRQKDIQRQGYLEDLGYKFIRIKIS
jgi:hypothetical protein